MPRHRNQPDLLQDVREIRIQAIHMVGEDPSLAGVQVFWVDDAGQWSILETHDVGPFDGPDRTKKVKQQLRKLIDQLLD